jgi:hypothetical protein
MYDFYIYKSLVLHFFSILLCYQLNTIYMLLFHNTAVNRDAHISAVFLMLIALSDIFGYLTALRFSLGRIIGVLLHTYSHT